MSMDAFVCIDDQYYTRANAPYNVAVTCTRITQSNAETVRQFTAAKGKKATVIAVEDNFPGTGGGGGGVDPATLKSPSAVYFAEWQGSPGDTSEEGVIHLQLDGDRSVIALFDIMPLLRWGKINENHPAIGGGCFDFALDAAKWLRFPNVEHIVQNDTCISGGVNGDVVLYGQLKPGSKITLTAQDFPGSDLIWVEWRGAPCGAARACTITVEAGKDISTVAVWRSPQ